MTSTLVKDALKDGVLRIVVDAGHGLKTSGKQTPIGEKEWSFNNKVLLAFVSQISKYKNVQILRVDDTTGKTDIPLNTRVKKANNWGADIYISFHHNANTGTWGTWTGTETYVYSLSNAKSVELAKVIHKAYVSAMGLKDRGIKTGNFAVIRDTNMPAILLEGGYMDSSIDIKKMRDNQVLSNSGIAMAQGIAEHFRLAPSKEVAVSKPLEVVPVKTANVKPKTVTKGVFRIKTGTFPDSKTLADAVQKMKTEFIGMVYEKPESLGFNPDYRIYTGTFTTKEDAEAVREQLKSKFGWVTHLIDETR